MAYPDSVAEFLIPFTRRLATALSQGQSLPEAATGLDDNEALGLTVKRLREGVELDKALSPNLGKAYRHIVSGGVSQGEAVSGLQWAADWLEQDRALRERGNTPVTVAFTLFLVFLFGLLVMALGPVRTWILGHLWTVLRMALDSGMREFLIGGLVVAAIGLAQAPFLLREYVLLRLPRVGHFLMANDYARALLALAAMLQAGTSLPEALEAVDEISLNGVLRGKLRRVTESIRGGQSLFQALNDQDCFGVEARIVLRQAESSGELPQAARQLVGRI